MVNALLYSMCQVGYCDGIIKFSLNNIIYHCTRKTILYLLHNL